MPDTAQLADLRSRIQSLLVEVRNGLGSAGFEPYRVGELLHPKTRRHVRISYSGGEWRVTRGVLPRIGPNPMGGQAVTNLGVREDGDWRFDRRLFQDGRALPTVDTVLSWALGETWPEGQQTGLDLSVFRHNQ